MLRITIPGGEEFDDATSTFTSYETITVRLEHSLVSLSKWESKWCLPFLSDTTEKTDEQTLDYIRCMDLDDNPDFLPRRLSQAQLSAINAYISSKATATTFSDERSSPSREIITSEVIYHWMVALTIPFECQYWHLNRLITLVKVCNKKNQPNKKMSRADLAARNRQLNAQRRAQMGTQG